MEATAPGSNEPEAGWIGAAAAARRLGVKPATLYSYVSRGVLTRRRAADGRASLFAAAEVAALARRGRPRQRGLAPGDLVIESAITQISGQRLTFRGREATALAAERSFEEVAGLLWKGALAGPGEAAGWTAPAAAVAAGTAAQSGLPLATLPLERLQVIVPALAAADPFRLQLDPPAVIAAARSLIAGMVDCLPAADGAAGAGSGPVADRLWDKLCQGQPVPGLRAALGSALVLLADHELAPSTFAARVSASVRADPYAVVATGLGAVGGALHGGASLGAETMLAAAREPADAPRVVGDLLRRGERIPGFGHMVYSGSDPRAEFLLTAVRTAAAGSPRLAAAEAVLAEMRRRGLPQPNIDFALATLTRTAGMIRGAAEAVFAVARTAGWVAHALEEYQRRAPMRPRAVPPGNQRAAGGIDG